MRSIPAVSRRLIHIIVVASLGMLALIHAGCASSAPRQPMVSSTENTSGVGTVQAKAGPNGNTQVEVRVKHLSAPSRIATDANVYVVWIQPRNGEIQNVGALQVDEDLVGKLNTTTPHRVFTLTVTPEPAARMAAPTHTAVFTTEVNRTE